MQASAASIRNLLVVVLVLSGDFYLIRDRFDRLGLWPYFNWPEPFQFGFLGSLPMLNLVVVGGSVILSRGGERRRFLAGFVLSGALAVVALLSLSLLIPEAWSSALDPLPRALTRWLDRQTWFELERRSARVVYRLAIDTPSFAIPELLIATAGGLAARKPPPGATSRGGIGAP